LFALSEFLIIDVYLHNSRLQLTSIAPPFIISLQMRFNILNFFPSAFFSYSKRKKNLVAIWRSGAKRLHVNEKKKYQFIAN
jgi:hypothetical protein